MARSILCYQGFLVPCLFRNKLDWVNPDGVDKVDGDQYFVIIYCIKEMVTKWKRSRFVAEQERDGQGV